MKRLIIFVALLVVGTSLYAGQITKDYTFSAGSTISSSEVNENFDDLFTVINGNIEGGTSGNIAADTITEREMADDVNPRIRWDEGLNDFVYTGLQPATSASLTSNISAGTAYVEGYRVNKSAATSHTYTASKVTYVDISKTGVFTYTETALGAATPAVASNSTRLAAAETSASAITNVTDMRTLTPYTPYAPTGSTVATTYYAVATQVTTNGAGGETIAFDTSKPQSGEGKEMFTKAVIGSSASNYWIVDVTFHCTAAGGQQAVVGLFLDSETDARSSFAITNVTNNTPMVGRMTYYMAIPDTNSHTFKVRAGMNTNNLTMNGVTGSAYLDGTYYSSIKITEIKG